MVRYTNPTIAHPKLTAVPIGLGNSHWPHGNTQALARTAALDVPKRSGLHVNFEVATNPAVRGPVMIALRRNRFSVMARREKPIGPREMLRRLLGWRPVCKWTAALDFASYLRDLARWKYRASPPGNGVDCHRTWESVYLGVIPVLSAAPVGLLDGLPHIMLDNLDSLTEQDLDARASAITGPLELEKLTLSYWRRRMVDAVQHLLRALRPPTGRLFRCVRALACGRSCARPPIRSRPCPSPGD